MQKNNLNILIVEDIIMLYDGIKNILQKYQFNVFFAKNGKDALEIYKKNKYQIILTDINMPEMSGLELCKQIKQYCPEQKIIVFTQHIDRATISSILFLGIDIIVSKIFANKDLLKAIENTLAGRTFYSIDILKLKNAIQNNQQIFRLTKREHFLLPYFCKGLSNNKIKQVLETSSKKIFLSSHTIETHRKNIYFKLEVHNSAELAEKARNLGFLY